MTTSSKGATAPKKKSARTNQRAIFTKAEKHTGELPIKKSGGRKSLLAPLVDQLRKDPDAWYRVAHGLKGTVGQTRTRLLNLGKQEKITLEVETRTDPDNKDMATCYARYIAPKS